MAVDGRITPVIDHVFAFEHAADAMAHLATRRARGKVVVAVTAS
jgi:NADPH:quinone reductase-like Zn-dependent oxidoreductase